jgi:hypothetical protein
MSPLICRHLVQGAISSGDDLKMSNALFELASMFRIDCTDYCYYSSEN